MEQPAWDGVAGPVGGGEPPWQPIRLDGSATGGGSVYQAGRDLTVIRKPDGPRRTRPGSGAREMPCPYPGLMPFGAEHRDWFYGRDQVVHTVLERLDARMREGGPLVLIGASGAGKSSLLAAGVLPALGDGRLPAAGSSGWSRVTLTPTASPARALAAAVGLDTDRSPDVADPWRSDPSRFVAEVGERHADGLVVVVDQFEEVFTACADEAERAWFVEVLDLLAAPEGGAAVVLSLRADFYAACTSYPQLRTALQAGPVVLGSMTENELKQAIRLPAEDVELEVEDGLVELLLADLGAVGGLTGTGSAGRLPLLAHALRATWQQRSGHRLTVDGYGVTGGIRRALANTADRLFDALAPAGRDIARWVFLRLVTVGRDTDDTRRRVRYDDLLGLAPDPGAARTVVDDFTRGRLLTRDQDSVTITHEVLIRTWPRLREWIEQDRDGNLVRQDLEEAAAAWDHAGREPGALYRGNRLEIAHAWAEKHVADVSAAARAFLDAARHHQRRGQRLRRAAVAAITVLALVASTAAVFAFILNTEARKSRDEAIDAAVTSASLRLAPTDPSLSAQLALTAYRMNPSPEAGSRLITAANTPLDIRLPGSEGSAYTTAYSPDGHTLAVGYVHQNVVRLWDVSDPSHPVALGRPLPEDPAVDSILSVGFSPDGRTLAVGGHANRAEHGGSGGFVDLWDLTSPSHPVLRSRPTSTGLNPFDAMGAVQSLDFSPDGRTLAAGRPGVVSLWKVDGPDQVTPAGDAFETCLYQRSVAFSPDSRTLAVACDSGVVGLWNTTDPSRPTRRGEPFSVGGNVSSVAFSPDGRTLAAGVVENDVRLWNVTDPEHPTVLGKPLTGPAQAVTSVAFSPDGHVLAAGGADRTVHLWNVTDTRYITPLGRPLSNPGGSVLAVAFSPDSRTLAAANADGDVHLWNLPSTRLVGGGGNVASVAFSPDGRTLAAGNQNGTVSLWNTTDPGHPAPRGTPMTGPSQAVTSVAFSPDGRTLAAGDSAGVVTVWSTADPDHPVPLGEPLTGVNGVIFALEFSPDGSTLVAAGDDYDKSSGIVFWDVRDPARPTRGGGIGTDHTRSILSLAFSPDGRTLATGGDTSTHEVGLWSTTAFVRVGQPLPQPTGTTAWVDFSPDGRTLATGNSNGTITLWDSTDPHHLTPRGQPLTMPGNSLWSIAFSPDGKTLAAAGHAAVGTIALWDVTDPDHPAPVGEPLTVTTGPVSVLAFSPDGRTLAATTDHGVATVWDLTVEAAVRVVCANSAGALDSGSWAEHVPIMEYTPPCP